VFFCTSLPTYSPTCHRLRSIPLSSFSTAV
jgi:hypothetical protein